MSSKIEEVEHFYFFTKIMIFPERDLIYSSGWYKKVHEWSLSSLKRIRDIEDQDVEKNHTYSVYDFQIYDNGSKMVTAGGDCLIKVWDLKSNSLIETLVGHKK